MLSRIVCRSVVGLALVGAAAAGTQLQSEAGAWTTRAGPSRARPRGRSIQDRMSRIVCRSVGRLALVGATAAGTLLQSQAGPALYTQAPAARGQQTYTASCASCHGADLQG